MTNIGQKFFFTFYNYAWKRYLFCAFAFKVCKENNMTKNLFLILQKLRWGFQKCTILCLFHIWWCSFQELFRENITGKNLENSCTNGKTQNLNSFWNVTEFEITRKKFQLFVMLTSGRPRRRPTPGPCQPRTWPRPRGRGETSTPPPASGGACPSRSGTWASSGTPSPRSGSAPAPAKIANNLLGLYCSGANLRNSDKEYPPNCMGGIHQFNCTYLSSSQFSASLRNTSSS